ncbi:MAG: transposase [Bacteroidales bacterium]|nr:transposase [Bacteroidales bacterium]
MDWYLFAIEKQKELLLKLTSYVVADSWFAKSTFYQGLNKMGFHLISRFRDDAHLMYITTESRTGRKGRPKKFDGKIDFSDLDLTRFEKLNFSNEDNFFSAIVHCLILNIIRLRALSLNHNHSKRQ